MWELTERRTATGVRLALALLLASGGGVTMASPGFAGESGAPEVQLAQTQQTDEAPPPAVDTSHPRAKLVLASNGLAGKIDLSETRFRKLGNFTQAQVTIQNRTLDPYVLEYKFDWHDEDWFATGQKTVWHRFKLSPNQIETLQSMGKTPEASGIILTVRFPEDATIQ